MFRKSLYEELDNMSYEQQKEALRLLEEDTQQYDDSWDIITPVVEAVVNVFKTIFK